MMMHRYGTILLGAVALAALLGSPAFAQMPHINMMPELKSKTPEEIEREEKANKAYRDSLRKIPDAKGAADPWGDVRGAEAAKPAAKSNSPPAKRAKADAPANGTLR